VFFIKHSFYDPASLKRIITKIYPPSRAVIHESRKLRPCIQKEKKEKKLSQRQQRYAKYAKKGNIENFAPLA